jgi:hypothetical protein
VHTGLCQQKYEDEIVSQRIAVDALLAARQPTTLFDLFNGQFLNFALAERGAIGRTTTYAGNSDGPTPIFDWKMKGYDPTRRTLMVRRSYTWTKTLAAADISMIERDLETGRVAVVGGGATQEALPAVIEIGESVAPSEEGAALGKRIRFIWQRYGGALVIPTRAFRPAYKSIVWLAADAAPVAGAKPIYRDAHFVAYDVPVEGGTNYSLDMPAVYLGERDPRTEQYGATK